MGNIFPIFSTSKDKQVLTFGPHGGQRGDEWDDGINDGVKQLIIYTENETINSIEIEYVKNGDSFWSQKRGGEGGTAHPAIKLDYPSEYLVSMTVYCGKQGGGGGGGGGGGDQVVQSLKFGSNKHRQFGPYGTANRTPLKSQSGCGKIVGFKGKSSDLIDSIGAYFLN